MKKLKLNLDELRNQLESIGADDTGAFMGDKAICYRSAAEIWLYPL